MINLGIYIFLIIWWYKKICKGKICLCKLLGEIVVKLNLYYMLFVENFFNGYFLKIIFVICCVYFWKFFCRIEGVVIFKIVELEVEGGVVYIVVFWGYDRF